MIGGIGEWMRVAHAAATFDIPVAPRLHACDRMDGTIPLTDGPGLGVALDR